MVATRSDLEGAAAEDALVELDSAGDRVLVHELDVGEALGVTRPLVA